ncbi:MAG: Dam family site-specific DNA-(adenine-N6)-methyltransferase [Syntrophorhabdaceae bacterium]|nr:Dam family site-specific DNA-(adenine-N6)-methyltransferase [Syntrophorhabdaceae bacterium]
MNSHVEGSVMSNQPAKTPIRYPGGKQRFLNQIVATLPRVDAIEGHFVEPFLGGGSVFFAIQAKPAILSDKNSELIDLYKGIRRAPHKVWEIYSGYKSGKREYYRIRRQDTTGWDVISKAARTLYLNRTCFKGMWRQNSQGRFNIGYGGQGRRWAIAEEDLVQVAKALRGVKLLCADFETVVDASQKKDFIFLDPPYHPGRRESRVDHYMFAQFTFTSHQRLAASLNRATERGVRWVMTISSHEDIKALYPQYAMIPFRVGVGHSPGHITKETGEVLVMNF